MAREVQPNFFGDMLYLPKCAKPMTFSAKDRRGVAAIFLRETL